MKRIPKYRWAVWSGVANLLGSFFLLIAFNATSTNFFMFQSETDHVVGLCAGDPPKIMLGADDKGTGMSFGMRSMQKYCGLGKRTAVVNTDHPIFSWLGFGLLVVGFAMQLKSIDHTEAKLTKHQRRILENMGLAIE